MKISEHAKLLAELFDRRLPKSELENCARNALDQEYWRALNPDLSVCTGFSAANVEGDAIDATSAAAHARQFAREGYLRTEPSLDARAVTKMQQAVKTLLAHRWPPVFSFVYDEFWQVVRTPSFVRLASAILGAGYRQNSRIWTFYVAPAKGARGWEPHSDGGKGESRLTVWVPLTDATLENGCMYAIPRDRLQDDLRVSYAELDTVTNAQLTRLLHNTQALPARAGAYLGWDHELIHWGSVSSGAGEPRISIAVEFVGPDLAPRADELPVLEALPQPSFSRRVGAIGKALFTYARYEPEYRRFAELARLLIDSAAQQDAAES